MLHFWPRRKFWFCHLFHPFDTVCPFDTVYFACTQRSYQSEALHLHLLSETKGQSFQRKGGLSDS